MVTVRDATVEDAPAIHDLHVAAVRARGPAAYDDEQVAAWADGDGPESVPVRDRNPDRRVVVAERDGRVVGFGQLNLDEPGGVDGPPVPEEAEVGAVYVHPDHDRSGVGSALLARLEDLAREAGVETLRLLSSLNAVGFYERRGYERGERYRLQNTGGVYLETVWMAKELA